MSLLAINLFDRSLINRTVYRPNLRTKSDADILRDTKLEAMGMPAQNNSPRRTAERTQMATDEIVDTFLLIYCPKTGVFMKITGDGTFQETDAKVIVLTTIG